ncbi:GL11309 [Drosophila persimilis]|uniref:GL11309 n=1 Tax=Drosophila persimilis TaxID=7234 RepID=B4GA43_DROPE|nr:GL11309 [Drosophila persimilis]
MSETENSSMSSESEARDSALPASNGMRSAAAIRNYMGGCKQRFGPAHKRKAVLNLAAQRLRRMSPEHVARSREPTSMFLPIEALSDCDLEPSYDGGCGVKPKRRISSKRKPKGSCGNSHSKRPKSSSVKRRRRMSAPSKKSKRDAKHGCGKKPKKARKPKRPVPIYPSRDNEESLESIVQQEHAFDFHSDPEAAHAVLLRTHCPITIIPSEPCLQERVNMPIHCRLEAVVRHTATLC